MGLIVNPDADAPLQQGDILQGVLLYATAEDGDGASPIDKVEYTLVLSRHCNATRKPQVIVAGITEYTPDTFTKLNELGLDETRRRLDALRDGDGSPDRFYLGPLPNREPRRAFAHLDIISSIQIPKLKNDRVTWISNRRIGTLSTEHRRHLHVSLLLAFAREGFDDYAWWPDADLKIMIAAGKRAVSEATKKQAEVLTQREGAAAGGVDDAKLEKKISNLTREVKVAGENVDKAQESLNLYLDEWNNRYPGKDPMA